MNVFIVTVHEIEFTMLFCSFFPKYFLNYTCGFISNKTPYTCLC